MRLPKFVISLLQAALGCCLLLSSTALADVVRHAELFESKDFSRLEAEEGVLWQLRGGAQLRESGAPALPLRTIALSLPFGHRAVSVEIVPGGWEAVGEAAGLALAPALLSEQGESVPYRHHGSDLEWSEASTFPESPALLLGSSVLHGYSIAHVDVVAMRINSEGQLERMTGYQLSVRTELGDVEETMHRQVDWPGIRDRDLSRVRGLVENPAALEGNAPPRGISPSLRPSGKTPLISDGPVDYVIVTIPALATEFQRLADDRKTKGLTAAVVTTDWILANYRQGADLQETIRGFLRRAYQDWGLQYALLGGDADILPPRYARSIFYPVGSFTDVPADLYFAALDGNWNANANGVYGDAYEDFTNQGDLLDFDPEIALGRAPVRNLAHTTTFVDKTIEYETPSSPEIYGNALFFSEVLFPSAWNGVDPIALDGATYSENIIFNSILGGGNLVQSFRLYENYTAYFGSEPETKQACMDSMQTGRYGLVNHTGHGFYYNMSVGDGNIFVSDQAQLQNGPNYFFLHALNCSSGAFDFDCLLESFVQNPNGGSVASIGSSRSAFPTVADKYQQAFFDEVFVLNNQRMGDAVNGSRSRFTATTFAETPDRWTQFGYTALGDPALRIWRTTPTNPTVTHLPSLPLGTQDLLVDVEVGGGGLLSVSVVAIGPDGSLVRGKTNLAGLLTLELGHLASQPGNIELYCSGQGIMPYHATIPIDPPSGAAVAAALDSIDDDLVAPSAGDADGAIDAGEVVELSFSFENNGDGTGLSGLYAKLEDTLAQAGVTVLVDSIDVGSLSGGQSLVASERFVVQFDPTMSDGDLVTLELTTSDGVDSWKRLVELTVLAPELLVSRISIDDSLTGNNDGVQQAGETVELYVELTNFGAGVANSVAGTLSTGSGNVTLIDDANSWSALTLKAPSNGVGVFSLSESDVVAENFILLTLVDEHGRTMEHWLELRLPAAPVDPSVDTSLGTNTIALRTEHQPSEPHFAGYRFYRSESALGPFAEVTQTYLDYTGFFHDTGLAPLTRYYYYATTVDSFAVESGATAIVDASTSPPEMEGGFPIVFGREMSGPIAVGDMRGDATQVVGFGADFLYAIDSGGFELIDGDLDAQTLGPLAGPPSPNNRFTPSGVAMADLDDDGSMELIGSNWQTFEIWVVRADGSNFPGWPKQMNNKSWATPAVGDLDNDGDLEIVVNNVGSWTFVWHHDGSDFFDGDGNPGTVGYFHTRPGESFNRSTPALLDVDSDGTLELLFGTHVRNGNDNFVYALKNDGSNAPGWGKNLGPTGYNVGAISCADMDADGLEEIVYLCDNDSLYVWQPDGSNKAGFPIAFTSQAGNRDSVTPAPGFGDFDLDSDLEMVVVSIVGSDDAYVHIKDVDGTTLPGWPIHVPGLSECSPLVGDMNGDGSPDVVFGIGGGGDGNPDVVYAWNADGSDVEGFPIYVGGAAKSTPVITDFDYDGDVDLLFAGFDRFLHAWDMPFVYDPSKSYWPTFHGNNHRDGVYAAPATPVLEPEFVLGSGRDGVVIRVLFDGAIPEKMRFALERQDIRSAIEGEWTPVAAGLRAEGGELYFVDTAAREGSSVRYRVHDEAGQMSASSQKYFVPAMRLALSQNSPNPFNPSTTLSFVLPGGEDQQLPISLVVHDLAGRRVRTLYMGPMGGGSHQVVWDGRDDRGDGVSSGTYFAMLRAGADQRSIKMTLVK